MCGIVGIAIKNLNGFSMKEQSTFEELLYIDALRGMDSTGITAFFNDGSVSMVKSAHDAHQMKWWKYAGADEYGEVMSDLFKKGKAALGHNRKATIGGKPTDETSHPFNIADRWFFMHNGTLRNHQKLGDNKFVVDSEALGNHICHLANDKEAFETALSDVEGAFACQWVDKEKEMLYLVRNRERPLHLAETSAGYIWASEPAFIYAAANRNGIKVEKCEEVKPDVLYSLDLTQYNLKFTQTGLSLKKAIPPITQVIRAVGGAGMKVSGGTNNSATLSKNQFKKLSKRMVGQWVNFWLDDWMENTLGVVNGNWRIWGTNDELFNIRVPHRIAGVVKGISEHQLKAEYDGAVLNGKIIDMEYDPNCLYVVVENIKPNLRSLH